LGRLQQWCKAKLFSTQDVIFYDSDNKQLCSQALARYHYDDGSFLQYYLASHIEHLPRLARICLNGTVASLYDNQGHLIDSVTCDPRNRTDIIKFLSDSRNIISTAQTNEGQSAYVVYDGRDGRTHIPLVTMSRFTPQHIENMKIAAVTLAIGTGAYLWRRYKNSKIAGSTANAPQPQAA
jgi:hypothetical protein